MDAASPCRLGGACDARVKPPSQISVAALVVRTIAAAPPYVAPQALGRGGGPFHVDVRNAPSRPATTLVRGITFGSGELFELVNRHRVTVVVDDRREMEPFAAQFANGLERLEGSLLRNAGRRVRVSCHDPIGHGVFPFLGRLPPDVVLSHGRATTHDAHGP